MTSTCIYQVIQNKHGTFVLCSSSSVTVCCDVIEPQHLKLAMRAGQGISCHIVGKVGSILWVFFVVQIQQNLFAFGVHWGCRNWLDRRYRIARILDILHTRCFFRNRVVPRRIYFQTHVVCFKLLVWAWHIGMVFVFIITWTICPKKMDFLTRTDRSISSQNWSILHFGCSVRK